ncbi:hypothetical protein BZM27_45730 [Paraburkholderia steynii]|uniref:Uncharacterized protein n=1 Tax=Paraburkholderia steynii TaxID=1245441 RepID=A0A4R0X184_9BURK|nr:hypothetical protein BZM27_45730 [Paraburkholderia steynii]
MKWLEKRAQTTTARCPKASAPFYSFLLESLNRRTIVCRRFDDDVSPIMFDLRIAIQVGANLARA